MIKPVVSICIITYNHEKHIIKCIEGALKQIVTFPYEIIIGEDCSSDNTRQICKDYQQKYPDKIRLICNTENLGMIGNWINTIKSCDGKYISLCEGDDFLIHPINVRYIINYIIIFRLIGIHEE